MAPHLKGDAWRRVFPALRISRRPLLRALGKTAVRCAGPMRPTPDAANPRSAFRNKPWVRPPLSCTSYSLSFPRFEPLMGPPALSKRGMFTCSASARGQTSQLLRRTKGCSVDRRVHRSRSAASTFLLQDLPAHCYGSASGGHDGCTSVPVGSKSLPGAVRAVLVGSHVPGPRLLGEAPEPQLPGQLRLLPTLPECGR